MSLLNSRIAALAILALAAAPASAQTGARPQPIKPAKAEAKPAPKEAAPKAEGGAKDAGEDPLRKIFGEKGFSLNCQKGITFEQDLESGELKFMRIEGSIDLKSELMNLKCENIVIDNVKQLMTATAKAGTPVDFTKEEMSGVCGKLVYEMESKKTLLLGPPRPFIRQKDKNGNITQTSADTITIIETEKTRNVLLEGKSEINSISAEEKKPEKDGKEDKPKEPAKKIDGNSTDKIRTPSLQQ